MMEDTNTVFSAPRAQNESNHFHNDNSLMDYNILLARNDEMAQTLLPVVVYISILMTLGTLGNIVVCYIYFFRWKAKTVKYFIGCLALMDLITCVICMPIEIAMLQNPLLLDIPILCKFLRFTRAMTSLCGGFMLIVIAVDRFRRICRHNQWQIEVSGAKKLCWITIIAGTFFASPCFIIFGSLDRSDVLTIETSCSTDQRLSGTFYPTIYYGIIFLLFLIISVCLVFFYTMIGVKLCRMPIMNKSVHSNRYSAAESTNSSQTDSPEMSKEFLQKDKIPRKKSTSSSSIGRKKSSSTSNSSTSLMRRLSIRNESKNGNKTRKTSTSSRRRQTTFILFLITMIEWLSFFPYIGLLICQSVIPEFLENMTAQGQVAYNLGILSHFLSSGINPFIYGFLGRDFRKQCRLSIKELKARVPDRTSWSIASR